MINLKWPAPRLPPSPPLRRPAPAPYFHPFLNFSDPPSPLLGGVIKIYFFSLHEGGGGYKLCSIIMFCAPMIGLMIKTPSSFIIPTK